MKKSLNLSALMLIVALITFALFTLESSGQITNLKVPQVVNTNPGLSKYDTIPKVSEYDTVPKVQYITPDKIEMHPAYYLNGQFVNETILKSLNMKGIESIRVEKEDVVEDSQKYYGKIFITTKESYKLSLISLNKLKSKYTNLKKVHALFMIDNEIINDDYDKYQVDERYILKITIEKVDRAEGKLKLYVIRIFTRSEENIMRTKTLRIRGEQLLKG
jgi:hypothetical protein